MPPFLLIKANSFKFVGLVILEEPNSFRIKFTGPEFLEVLHNGYEWAAGRSLGLEGLTVSHTGSLRSYKRMQIENQLSVKSLI